MKKKKTHKTGVVVVHASKPSTVEVEEEYSELKASLDYVARP